MSVSAFPSAVAAANATLTLSGQSVTEFNTAPTDSYARLKVDNDGNMYQSRDTGSVSWSLIDSATDWVRPTSAAPGDYEVRFTGASNTPTSSTVAEDVWHPLSSGDFIIYNSLLGIGSKSTTFTLEIRKGSSGGADVTGSYSLTAEVDSGV